MVRVVHQLFAEGRVARADQLLDPVPDQLALLACGVQSQEGIQPAELADLPRLQRSNLLSLG